MGFYLRKSFRFGPMRLNLSRSGLGASFGVKGARIGVGPRGRYIHMGRGGVYYRQSLSPRASDPTVPEQPIISTPSVVMQEIESAPVDQLSDSSSTELLAELNRVQRRTSRLAIVIVVSALLFGWMGLALSDPAIISSWLFIPALIVFGAACLWARNSDVTEGTVILNYELEGAAKEEYDKLKSAFEQLNQCQAIWHVSASGNVSDWKRNAGASALVHRKRASIRSGLPRRVVSNIKVPVLPAGRQELFFFPDRVLVYEKNGVGAVTYSDLAVSEIDKRFIEEETPPRDALRIDTTWRYVNKKGGPDRRFNNNQELPVMLYGELSLQSSSGLNELFQCSRTDFAASFARYFTLWASSASSASAGQ